MSLTDGTWRDVILAVERFVRHYLDSDKAPVTKSSMAVFVAANAIDANLSKVKLMNGTVVDYIPKGNHVTGLVAGDPVLLVKAPGVALTIIAKVHGDITIPTTQNV